MQTSRKLWIAAVCAVAMVASVSTVRAQQTNLLPPDSELVVTINFQQIMKSEVVKANKAILDIVKGKIDEQLDEKGLAKYLKKAGFDVFRDLSTITISIPADRNPEEGFILLEGTFDAEKIEAAFTDASKDAGGGLKIVMIGNAKAFEVSPKGEKSMLVGVLNKKTLIACLTKKDFGDAVARSGAKGAGKFKSETVTNLLQTVTAKQSISFVATSKVLGKLAENAPEGAPQAKMAVEAIKQMDGFSAAITIQKDIDVQLGLNMKDADTANKTAAGINFAITLFKGKVDDMAKGDEKAKVLADVMNTLRASSKGPNIVINARLTFENLGKLLQSLPLPNN
ncbi:MAG: hypothetical protein EXS16_17840 [Gemmataceae bacterium]|nr:hypothetical protein [Gemmataceae bacterium]